MFLSEGDIFTGGISIAIIAATAAGILFCTGRQLLRQQDGRKLLHLVAISTCGWAISRFEQRDALAYIFLLFFLLLLLAVRRGFMQVGSHRSYGIALFPLAFFLLLKVPVFPPEHIVFAALALAVGDAVAGFTGSRFARRYYVFWQEEKSMEGLLAGWLINWLLAVLYYRLYSGSGILFACCLSLLPALTELFSYRGSDNLSVPLVAAAWATLLFKPAVLNHNLYLLPLALLVMLVAAVAAVYKKWLSRSGAAAALWMGLIFFAAGGLRAFAVPVLFLVSGSLLSRLNKDPAESGGRSGVQVFANGLPGALCLLLYGIYGTPLLAAAAVLSFAISMSDSVSSELGRYLGGSTVDIIGFKHIKPGLSGGISAAGTAAGLVGAILPAITGGLLYHFSAGFIVATAAAGFCGMLADSVLGSLLQAKYRYGGGSLAEVAGQGASLVKGYAWCTNDMVNLLANLIVTSTAILLFFI